MAFIFGHSQVKYLHDCLVNDRILSLRYPGYKVRDFMKTQFSTWSRQCLQVSSNFYTYSVTHCSLISYSVETQQAHGSYTTSAQRRCNVMPQRRCNVDVEPTLYKRHVPAGNKYPKCLSWRHIFSIFLTDWLFDWMISRLIDLFISTLYVYLYTVANPICIFSALMYLLHLQV